MSAFEQSKKVRDRVLIKSLICSFAVTAAVFALLPSGGDLTADKKIEDTHSEAVFETLKETVKQTAKADTSKRISENLSARLPSMSPEKFDLGIRGITVNIPDAPASTYAIFNAVEFSDDAEISFESNAIFSAESLDKTPRLLTKTKIKYPPEMLKRGMEGIVRLSVIINKDGSASVEKVLESTSEAFEKSALEAAQDLKYEIPTKDSVAVRARFILPIPFTISK